MYLLSPPLAPELENTLHSQAGIQRKIKISYIRFYCALIVLIVRLVVGLLVQNLFLN
jgi:hypothetical protein